MEKKLKLGNFILKFWQLQKLRNIYALYVRFEGLQWVVKLPNFKKSFFGEFTSVYALHLAWWLFHETNSKMIFLTILMPENRIFGHFCPNLPKKCQFLNGRHNFLCVCRFARLKIYVRGLLLYFEKIKNNLKLVNFSRTCIPP